MAAMVAENHVIWIRDGKNTGSISFFADIDVSGPNQFSLAEFDQ